MARKIVQYDLVRGEDEVKFVAEVNQRIEKGWQPIGGPVMSLRDGRKPVLLQAVVKERETEG